VTTGTRKLLTTADGETCVATRVLVAPERALLRCQSSTRELTWRSGKWQGLTHGSVAAQPGGWQVAFAKEAAAKRRRGAQIRVRVVMWDSGVRLPVVERGVEWLSESWGLLWSRCCRGCRWRHERSRACLLRLWQSGRRASWMVAVGHGAVLWLVLQRLSRP